MSKIIASTYEIIREIGSGGGGVVYLGRHLRLGKDIVLKADRRTLTTKPETLRREVDALKNLSHTYIPQVYDFVVDGDTVYTVMDYIEGESLDKPLKRGERFSQAQVIEWACELLEALMYLHSRPPHGILHSDIKPGNIMLTPQGDIRLIDFNIALALGEEGTVRVGRSRGYASPEHYGLDYSVQYTTNFDTTAEEQSMAATEFMDVDSEVSEEKTVIVSAASSSGSHGKLLDVRSDIYSTGATLYHLLTGQRPDPDALNVEPIPENVCSPAVAQIIEKAMRPNPDERFQSAEEMLDAFEHLHENDVRARRHRRRVRICSAALCLCFLIGGVMLLAGQNLMKREETEKRAAALEAQAEAEEAQAEAEEAQAEAEKAAEQAAKEAAEAAEEAERAEKEAEQREKAALEAVTNAETALDDGDISNAVQYSLAALETENAYHAQAQTVLTEALGVYDLSDGYKDYSRLSLTSEPLKLILSPEGTRTAVLISWQVLVFDTESGEQLAALDALDSALDDLVFLDESRLLYAGANGLSLYDVDAVQTLWTGAAATAIAVSEDGTTAAAVCRDESFANVYRVSDGQLLYTVDFGGLSQSVPANDVYADTEDSLLSLNADGTRLAVSFDNGALWIYCPSNRDQDICIYDASDFTSFEGGFYGQYFAFSTIMDGESDFAVIDTVGLYCTLSTAGAQAFHVQADSSGIYLWRGNTLVKIDPLTAEQTKVAYTGSSISGLCRGGAYLLTLLDNGTLEFYNDSAQQVEALSDVSAGMATAAGQYAAVAPRNTPAVQILRLEEHADTVLATYDNSDTHVEARVSADGETIMLFRYDGFRIYAMDGTLLYSVEIPDADEVYDQQFRRDGSESWLEVTYNSGLVQNYSARDGSVIGQTQIDAPDGTLYEEFYTDSWKITSPLQGTPEVYSLETGELLFTLEAEDDLTYVTQVGDYVITEYSNAQLERYGLLLNEDGETLAKLPQLCDILSDGTLVFDDNTGTLRQSHIYSLEELLAAAQADS